ncbi:MAG: sensor histidine kinase, partial [Chloroflexi bacterium]|nr:sensor histidine kinase [Chloroflexota bacterium]
LIARQLHDDCGQLLTGLKLQLEMGSAEAIPTALSITLDLMKHVRLMAQDLRPAALDDFGLVPALESLCTRFADRTGVLVSLDCKEYAGGASAAVEEAAFRVVQEGVTNVARHAVVAEAQVEVKRTGSEITVLVRDAGQGTDRDLNALKADTSSMGIAAMFERVSALGGTPHFKSKPGSGTVVSATLPLEKSSD